MIKDLNPVNSKLIHHLTEVVTVLDEFDDTSQNVDYGSAVSGSELLVGFFRRNHKPGKILDIGCGGGNLYKQLPEITDGVEPNLLRFENAKKEQNFRVKLGYMENLPYEDKEFDTIISWGTFCFVRGLVESLAEANRVLKKEGVFVFDVVVNTVLPIAQTVNPWHFTNKYLPLFGFEILEKRPFAEPENHLRLGIAARKLSDFDYTNFLLPQVVKGKLINYKQSRDWFLK